MQPTLLPDRRAGPYSYRKPNKAMTAAATAAAMAPIEMMMATVAEAFALVAICAAVNAAAAIARDD